MALRPAHRALPLVARALASFVLATLGGFLGTFAGLVIGVAIDNALGSPLGRSRYALTDGPTAWLAVAVTCAGLVAGAALFALLPQVLADSGSRPARALAGAASGLALLALVAGDQPISPALLFVPLGAAIGASWTRADLR